MSVSRLGSSGSPKAGSLLQRSALECSITSTMFSNGYSPASSEQPRVRWTPKMRLLAEVVPCAQKAPIARPQDMKRTRKKHRAASKAKVALMASGGNRTMARAGE
jgi:hypothetical protein